MRTRRLAWAGVGRLVGLRLWLRPAVTMTTVRQTSNAIPQPILADVPLQRSRSRFSFRMMRLIVLLLRKSTHLLFGIPPVACPSLVSVQFAGIILAKQPL